MGMWTTNNMGHKGNRLNKAAYNAKQVYVPPSPPKPRAKKPKPHFSAEAEKADMLDAPLAHQRTKHRCDNCQCDGNSLPECINVKRNQATAETATAEQPAARDDGRPNDSGESQHAVPTIL